MAYLFHRDHAFLDVSKEYGDIPDDLATGVLFSMYTAPKLLYN